MKLINKFLRVQFLVTLLLITGLAYAKFSYRSGGAWDVMNPDGGNLTLGVTSDDDVIMSLDGTNVMTIDGATELITVSGALNGTSSTGLGWTIVTGANTACNTTCGISACVVGGATDFSALVLCTDATADTCLCTGAAS